MDSYARIAGNHIPGRDLSWSRGSIATLPTRATSENIFRVGRNEFSEKRARHLESAARVDYDHADWRQSNLLRSDEKISRSEEWFTLREAGWRHVVPTTWGQHSHLRVTALFSVRDEM